MEKSEQKLPYFKNYKTCSSYFTKFLSKIWPFYVFEDSTFSESTYGQIWPFYIFGPGNPGYILFVLPEMEKKDGKEELEKDQRSSNARYIEYYKVL